LLKLYNLSAKSNVTQIIKEALTLPRRGEDSNNARILTKKGPFSFVDEHSQGMGEKEQKAYRHHSMTTE